MLYLKNKILASLTNIIDNINDKCIPLDILGIVLKRHYSLNYGNIVIDNKTISLNTYIRKVYGSFKLFIINYTDYRVVENILY